MFAIIFVHVFLVFAVSVSNKFVSSGRVDWSIEKNASFWNEEGRMAIERALNHKENTRIAKNIILFVGDGMGMSTVTAGRIRKGQVQGQLGEDYLTEMEQLSNLGLSKTYSINHQTTDSAASATALLHGVKAQSGTIGVDGRAILNDCPSSIGTHIENIVDWAQRAGKKVGVVTTARITHATPAGVYAHIPDRNWESFDGKYFNTTHLEQGCTDIALQLVSRNPSLDVVLGGGRRYFYPTTSVDVEYSSIRGLRIDNRSLIEELWNGTFIWNTTEMNKFPLGSSEPLLGLFEPSHMLYENDRISRENDEPSLSRMTQFTIEHFLKFNQGFVLLVEGGRIDHGHHDTLARQALDEFVEFDNAVGEAKKILLENGVLDDSLIVVTADHSHMFTIGAYSARGSNVFGFSTLENANVSDVDQLPVNIIAYGNGPNFRSIRNASYLHSLNTNLTNYTSPAALPMKIESHGAEDVPVYANGPWSHLFVGTFEQSSIPHIMAYAGCLGVYATRDGCSITSTSPASAASTASSTSTASPTIFRSSVTWISVMLFCYLTQSYERSFD